MKKQINENSFISYLFSENKGVDTILMLVMTVLIFFHLRTT